MKRLLLIAVLFIVATTVACKKTKGPADVKSAQPDNSIDSLLLMTAVINGKAWLTDSAYSYKIKNSGNDSGIINLKIIATQLKNDTPSTIVFDITGFTGKGEYLINPPFNTAIYYEGNKRHYGTSGVFTVRSDSGNILLGSFNFTADTLMVTKGTFSVALP